MARNVSEAANGSGEITQNIAGVAEAAAGTTRGANDTQKAAEQLVEMSKALRELVGRFNVGSNGINGKAAGSGSSSKSRATHA
jgi:methyl-accepting chemotaxis protein